MSGWPVGLHGIGPARHGLDALHRRDGRIQARRVVDEGRRFSRRRSRAGCARWRASSHQLRARAAARFRGGEELLPGGTQDLVGADALDQPLMQLLYQPIALGFVDDEGEVQIVGGLAHQIDLLVLEQLEGRPQLVQDAADVVPDQAQGGARARGSRRGTARRAPRSALASGRGSRVLAVGSSDTVTLVSEVETRSTDMPCCLKIWNASARKPT